MSKKVADKLSDKNKRFWALPKNEQRISVAKDVINQLRSGFYKAEKGTYFEIKRLRKNIPQPDKLDTLLNKIKTAGAACCVCGIGGCFTSLIRLGNKVPSAVVFGFDKETEIEQGDCINDDNMRPILRRVFTDNQIMLIESAFEGWGGITKKNEAERPRRKTNKNNEKYYQE